MTDEPKPPDALDEVEVEGEEPEREPWHEGPDEDVPEDSWLALDDDGLLHRIETLGSEEDEDDQLLEVVASHRHFFVRQEAAKRVRDRRRLFAYEDDRHVGQILVRHLNRREDLTYLERLAIRSRHVEVRSAAQVQLARVWRKLEAPRGTMPQGLPPVLPPPAAGREARAAAPVPLPVAPEPQRPVTSSVLDPDGVDASLLGWAVHFIVESAWAQLGTTATREILRRTQTELLPRHERLSVFVVGADAHVGSEVAPGSRIAREAVQDVAEWMVSFRRASAEVAPEVRGTTLRACTALMADALREAGFYAACDAAEGTLA
jgi:hypothetical protein